MRELRAISFTDRETSTALIEFSGRLKRTLPNGTVLDAQVHAGPPTRILLPIKDDYGEIKPVEFSETEVAAALVHYCMGRKVRLPAKGEKVLQIIGNQPTLLIWLPDTDRPGGGKPAPGKAALARRVARSMAG